VKSLAAISGAELTSKLALQRAVPFAISMSSSQPLKKVAVEVAVAAKSERAP